MTVDKILAIAIRSLKKAMPESLVQGSLVKTTRAFQASTSQNVEIDSDTVDVEIITDTFNHEEIIGTDIELTDAKLYIIANAVKSIDLYQFVELNGVRFKIKKLTDSTIGSKTALFTIAAQKV